MLLSDRIFSFGIGRSSKNFTCNTEAVVLALWHRCLPVNFVKFLRKPFLKEHLCWLLLVNFIKAIVKTWKKLKLELEFFKSARIFYKNALSFCWYIVFKIFHWKNKSLLLKYITRNRCGRLQNTIRHEVNI